MALKILQTTVALALCILASARPQTSMRLGDSWSIGRANDWVSSGNYLIYSCSTQASEVVNLLDLAYLWIQNALLSTDTPAYKAFFRSADPATVKSLLSAFTAGTNVTTKSHGSRRPTVVCVNAVDPGINAFWDLCKHPGGPVVIQPPNTSIVFLCPVFFERDLSPQATDCGTVNHAGTRMLTHSYIAATQYGFLIQALADMYIRELMPGVTPLSIQSRNENDCLVLPPDQAIRCATSYVFFLSNVRAGCTDFPSRVPIQRDRELLETDGVGDSNGTGIVTIDCGSNGANSTACSL